MHIRWWFYYNKEENANAEVFTEEQDKAIAESIKKDSFVLLPGDKKDIYINMDHVKLVQREIVNESPEKFEKVPEVQGSEGSKDSESPKAA